MAADGAAEATGVTWMLWVQRSKTQKAPGAEKARRKASALLTLHGVVAEADGGWRILRSSSARAACSRYAWSVGSSYVLRMR